MFCIADCNSFWSPNGGGVRRYHLEKINFYIEKKDTKYVFIMHDDKTFTEEISENVTIEHIRVRQLFRTDGYRTLIYSKNIEGVILKHRPDVIEVGSPFFLPRVVSRVLRRNDLATSIFGFWHNDFPITSFKRSFLFAGKRIAMLAEKVGWVYARKNYNKMMGVIAASEMVANRMTKNGIQNVSYIPLGVDLTRFNAKSIGKIDKSSSFSLFYAHRLNSEKGMDIVLAAYPILCKKLGFEPRLTIAGAGPLEGPVKNLTKSFENVFYLGHLKDKNKLAEQYRAADLGFALSKWETFGLSILESYACGTPVVAANDGAAYEHAKNSKVPLILRRSTAEDLAQLIYDFEQSNSRRLFKKNVITYASNFTWNRCFESQLELYKKGK
ncbi:MAG: glycosyltransferase [Ekhidna sp.]|nr:glycosyltransferase [Ekhidna sp.]